MRLKTLCCATVLACCSLFHIDAPAADWMQFGYDAAHSGNNPDEATITLDNVALLTRRYQVAMPATVDSAPVYRSNVVTPGGTKNLLFALSENGRLMAIDADNGAEVWFKTTTGKQPTTASPAIDPAGAFVYSYGIDGKVHKYQIGDGTEIVTGGWPQLATLKIDVEKGASSLAIATSGGATYLYSVTDGYFGDAGNYQGHLTTIDLATGAQTVFNAMCSNLTVHFDPNGTAGVNACSSARSGIWGRSGAVFDAGTGRVYVATGNGVFNANTGGFNWGDSVLALAPNGAGAGAGLPLDSYTPSNHAALNSADADLGSVSLVILPAPAGSTIAHLGMQSGKDSKLRLLNLDDLSGSGAPAHTGGELLTPPATAPMSVPQGGTVFAQPAAWVDSRGQTWTFVATANGISGLKLCFDANCIASSGQPMLVSQWQKTGAATSPILANGVLYHLSTCGSARCVMARDPATGTVKWSSENIGTVHWNSPILVNGQLFVMDRSNKLWAWELVGAPGTHTVTPSAGSNGSITPGTPQTVNDGAQVSFTLAPNAHYRVGTVSGCGGSLSGLVYTTAPITADCTVSATFAPITHVVTPSAGAHGSIAPATPQTVNEGVTTSFTLTPDVHYRIDAVTGCGGSLLGTTYTTAPVSADCTVNATFAPIIHTVTPQMSGSGAIAPATPQSVTDGVTIAFTLTPDAGHVLDSVTGCGGTLAGSTYTTAPIGADCTVNARFVPVAPGTHVVTPRSSGGGMIAPDVAQTVDDGAFVSFTLTPDAGHGIDSVDGCGGVLAGTLYTTAAITADCTVFAVFAPNGDKERIFSNGFEGANP